MIPEIRGENEVNPMMAQLSARWHFLGCSAGTQNIANSGSHNELTKQMSELREVDPTEY